MEMGSMKMAHTCYRVKDLEASKAFYKEAFGFEIAEEKDFPEHEFTLTYLSLPGDDYELELTYNYGSQAYDLGNGYGHVAIAVEDLEALHASQSEKGLDVTDLKQLPGDTKPRYFFVTDPDGYKIEVIRL